MRRHETAGPLGKTSSVLNGTGTVGVSNVVNANVNCH